MKAGSWCEKYELSCESLRSGRGLKPQVNKPTWHSIDGTASKQMIGRLLLKEDLTQESTQIVTNSMDPNQLVSTHFEKSLKDFRIENWELEYLDMFEDMLACYEARVKAHNKSSDTRNSPSSHTIPACGSSSSSPRSYPVEASKIEGLPLLISASPFTIKLSPTLQYHLQHPSLQTFQL